MPEIEFVDDDPAPSRHRVPATRPADAQATVGETPTRPPRLGTIRGWAPDALAAASAGAALIVPWQTLYKVTAGANGFTDFTFSFDGWGRISGQISPGGGHSTRYGILVYVAVGLLLVGAVLPVYGRFRQQPRARAAGGGLVIAGVGLLAGAVGSAWLELMSASDNYAAQAGDGLDNGPGYRFHIGTMLGFGLAAIVLGLAAVVLPLVLRPRQATAPEVRDVAPSALPVPPERPRFVPHADDELLDA